MSRTDCIRIFAILGTVFFLLSCNDNSTTTPVENVVAIRDDFFDPAILTVGVGRVVIWRHFGLNSHTVTSGSPTSIPGGLFDSGVVAPGGSFQFTFNAPGSYIYFCRIHGVAHTGTVNVQ